MSKPEREIGYLNHDKYTLQIVMERGEVCSVDFVKKGIGAAEPTAGMAALAKQLAEYLAGGRKRFQARLRLAGTPFQVEVWQALLEIPFGETRSYKDIALRIGRPRAFRAVGQAIHHNPIAIIVPCHRVIGSNGSLTGYAGGLPLKKQLLAHEQKVKAGK